MKNMLKCLRVLSVLMLAVLSCHSLTSRKDTGPAPVDSLHEKPWHTTTSPLPGVKVYPDSTGGPSDTTGIYDSDTTD